MTAQTKAVVGWRESLTTYTRPRILALLLLGFSAGLPFKLLFDTLSVWLREVGIERTTIGFFAWIGIIFSIKVFWAPCVDQFRLPVATRVLGQRRSWLLLAQVVIAAALFAMGGTDPNTQLQQMALLALVVAFASATQDICIDALRIELVPQSQQGAAAAMYLGGYRIAMIVSGAGSLYIADYFDWQSAYSFMALLMGVGMLCVLVLPEPQRPAPGESILHNPVAWFRRSVVGPFSDFFTRNGVAALTILLLIGLYRLSDLTMGVMANPFYIDLGYTKTQIADVSKVFGVLMTLLGAYLGGVLVVRYGTLRILTWGAAMVAFTNLVFALLNYRGADLQMLVVVVSLDNVSGGLAGSAFIAYLSSLTSRAYTATQYALFSSLMTLPGKFIGGWSGVMVDSLGYFSFFMYAACLGVPAILLTLWIAREEVGRVSRHQFFWQATFVVAVATFMLLIMVKLPGAITGSDSGKPWWLDELFHLMTFFVFAGLLQKGWNHSGFGWVKVLSLLGLGLVIEIMQLALPYRSAEWPDVLANCLGLAGFWLCLYYWPQWFRGASSSRA